MTGIYLYLCLILFVGLPAVCKAEEIAPFRLTGIEGRVVVDYLFDGLSTEQPGMAHSAEQEQSVRREEVYLESHSYVYHPNFLTLDIGGGPIRQDTRIDFNGSQEHAGKYLYNFTGRANFLDNKPINGSLFYDHLNPTVSVAPGESMVQENSRYGFDLSLSNPAIGFPINLGYMHTQTQGDSERRTQDDSLDQFYFDTQRSYGRWGSSDLQYKLTEQTSRSGSLNLPVQETQSTNQDLNVNTRRKFGADQEYSLANYISFRTRKYSESPSDLPNQSDFGFLLDFRARINDKLSLFSTYHHNRNEQGSVNIASQSLSGGLTYLPRPDIETSLGIQLDKDDADQYTVNAQLLDGSIRYKRPLWAGELLASYGARFEMRDQKESATPLVSVFDEQYTLSGTTQVGLRRPHVQFSSIKVTNLTQSQTFVEEVDYLLTVVGSETRIERLSSGSILDGEAVLIDYNYDIGGTYASNQFDQTVSLNWNMSHYLSLYLRWFKSTPKLTSGISTYPLNTIDSILLGADADVPLPFHIPFSIGGNFEFENHEETISPYTRTSGDIFLQSNGPLFGLANLRFSARRTQIEYDLSLEDIDLTGYELRLWTRRYGIDLSGILAYEKDIGGALPRTRRDASLNAIWRERQVTVTLSLVNSLEKQGGYERDHLLIRLAARRDI